MTSSRRSQDRPIKSVELRITFRADRATLARLRSVLQSAVMSRGTLEFKIIGEHPAEVEEKAKAVLETLRSVVRDKKPRHPPKDFKKRKRGRRLKN